jgi:hypothetical protein
MTAVDTPIDQQVDYLRKLYDSFEFFLTEVWHEVGLPTPAFIQLDIAWWLQHGPKRRGIRGFRGVSKTWITIAYVLWRLFRDPNERVMIVSKSEGHSKDSLHQIRKWIHQIPFLQHLVPDTISPQKGGKGQRDSATKFDVGPSKTDRIASVSVYGITGQIVGTRSTLIVSDDVETGQNTLTREMRLRLRENVSEFGRIIRPDCDIVMLGTPHHEESLYNHLPTVGFAFRSWPARYPKLDQDVPDLSPSLQKAMEDQTAHRGDPTWPEMFNDKALRMEEVNKTGWLMQFMLVSGLSDLIRYPLQLRDFIVVDHIHRKKAPISIVWGTRSQYEASTRIEDVSSLGFGDDGFYAPIMVDSQWSEYIGTKMWIDPSGKGEDRTGYAIIGYCQGNLFVKDVGGLSGGYSEDTLNRLALLARKHGVQQIYIENNFGQGMYTVLFEPVLKRCFVDKGDKTEDGGTAEEDWKATVEDVRVVGQKEIRIIEALEPVLGQHRIIIDRSVANNETLQHQITRITRERLSLTHDDEIESLAMCVRQWHDHLSTDPEKAADFHRGRKMDEELKNFRMAGAALEAAGPPRWHSLR